MMGRGAKFGYGNRATKRKAIGSRKKDRVSDESDEDYVIGEEESYEEESSEGKFARGNGGRKRKKERIRSREKRERCSDDSDEDYVIGEDGSDDENSEDYCASSAQDVSEESFDLTATGCSGDSWDEGRKVARSKPRKGFAGRGKLGAKRRKYGVSRVSVDSDDCVEDEDEDEDEEFMPDADDCLDDEEEGCWIRRKKKKSGVVRNRVIERKGSVKSRKRRESGASKVLVDSDDWVDDEDEDEDEEFIPDVDDCLDEEGSRIRRKSGIQNRVIGRKGSSKRRKTKRKLKKNTTQKKKKILRGRQGKSGLKKVMSSDDDFLVEDSVAWEKNKNTGRKRRKKGIVHSDSDVADSASSDFEENVSEEERDFIRELASNGDLTTCLTSSSPSKSRKKGRRGKKRRTVHSDSDFVVSCSSDSEYRVSEEERDFIRELAQNKRMDTCLSSSPKGLQVDGASPCRQWRTVAKKGKAKVVDVQLDMGKQVCGICLSEEQRGIIRGTLNSCLHYFCFACIMEWSKVESRCPVCKQRFTTISKPAKLDTGIGLRKTVFKVPRRDQVYRPSEEELRGYHDPYENVVCVECQQGGDDSLMLLCDICDTPAHTYCVGLGREVPEGNHGLCTEESVSGIGAEVFETHVPTYSTSQHPVSIPEQLISRGLDLLASPRYRGGDDIQVESPISGPGAATVSGRRRLRLQIHNLLSTNRMNQSTEISERNNGLPHASLVSDVATSRIEQDQVTFENANSLGSRDSRSVAVEGRVQGSERLSNCCGESPSCSVQNVDAFSARISHMRKQVIYDLNAAPPNGPADDSLYAEQEGTNSLVLGHEQCSQPFTGSSIHIFPCTSGEGCSSHMVEEAKEQVRAMVKRHLKHLSRDTDLEPNAFKDIARRSTHTILAACGFKHSSSKIVSLEPPSGCFHAEKEGRRTDLVRGCCSSCFDSYVRDVVMKLMKMRKQVQLG
ncbi:hypothetical protein AAC387_Pa09g0309 [Persea americana]